MVPAVALRHPDQLAAVVEIVQEILARVVDEGRALLVDDRANASAGGIDGQQPQHLVPALVVDERETTGVLGPADVVDAPGIGEQLVADRDVFPRRHVEQLRLVDGDTVAGLGVGDGVQFWLDLPRGRRLDEMHLAILALAGADGHELLRVGRPGEAVAVGVLLRAIVAQGELLAAGRVFRPDVVLLDEGRPSGAGRAAPMVRRLHRDRVPRAWSAAAA